MNNSTEPNGRDARMVALALRGVSMAIETVCRGRQDYFSELSREMLYELTTLLRQYASDLDALAALEPDPPHGYYPGTPYPPVATEPSDAAPTNAD